MNLDRPQHGLGKGDAGTGKLNQVLRPFHAGRQPAQDFLFEFVERLQARMSFAGEIDSGVPDLVERADRGAHHAGQLLDRFELAELHFRERLAHRDFQIVGINRPQQSARQARSELPHGQDLHAVSPARAA